MGVTGHGPDGQRHCRFRRARAVLAGRGWGGVRNRRAPLFLRMDRGSEVGRRCERGRGNPTCRSWCRGRTIAAMASYVFARVCDERHDTYDKALEDLTGW